jgi:hypothetical protein
MILAEAHIKICVYSDAPQHVPKDKYKELVRTIEAPESILCEYELLLYWSNADFREGWMTHTFIVERSRWVEVHPRKRKLVLYLGGVINMPLGDFNYRLSGMQKAGWRLIENK